jgi:hypothetical protein
MHHPFTIVRFERRSFYQTISVGPSRSADRPNLLIRRSMLRVSRQRIRSSIHDLNLIAPVFLAWNAAMTSHSSLTHGSFVIAAYHGNLGALWRSS